jgi:fatty-acyl-CoA synthase
LSHYFGHFLTVWARQRPAHCAIHFEGKDYSYAWLETQVRHCTVWLSNRGVGPEARVAYLGLNHPSMLVLLFALARQGAALVPLNYRLTVHEHKQQLADADVTLLVVDTTFLDHARALEVPVWPLSDLGDLGNPELSQAQLRLEPTVAYGGGTDHPPNDYLPNDLLLVYTSGTTGAPKGAVLTQNALLWNAINSIHAHDLTSADRVLIALPMFHVGGLNIMLTPALYVGASVAIHAKFDPALFLTAINTWRPSLTLLVPATVSAILSHADWASTNIDCFRLINTGSSIVPAALLEALQQRGVAAAQVYGSTETAPIAIYLRQEDTRRKLGSAGQAALHCLVKVMLKSGLEAPNGEVGEIYVKGPNVMRGYWRNALATRECFDNGWYKTGDLAYQDTEGFFWVVGRSKEMIISGGENIYPAEIESLFDNHTTIAECAVVGLPDERWGEVPVLAVVFKDPNWVDATRSTDLLMSDQLTGRLAKFKWPKRCIAVDSLPKTALGKVRKDLLREQLSKL